MNKKKKKKVSIGHAGLVNIEKRFLRLQSSCFLELYVLFKSRTEGPEENVIAHIITDLDLGRQDFKGTWSLLADAIAEHNIQQKEKDIWHTNG